MMIHLVQVEYPESNADIVDKMFLLRAQTFNDRLRWDVKVHNRREIDQFDKMNPLYVIATDEQRNVIASLRLLPTTGPHMLADVFAELLEPDLVIRSPRVLEVSRLAVNTAAIGHLPNGLSEATGALICGMFEAVRSVGIEFVVAVFDVRVERILQRAGCRFDRLCEPKKIGEVMTVVGLFDTSIEVTNEIRARNNLTSSLFAQADWTRLIPRAA